MKKAFISAAIAAIAAALAVAGTDLMSTSELAIVIKGAKWGSGR